MNLMGRRSYRPVIFEFDVGDEQFCGFTDDTRWNGYPNIYVAQPVRDRIAAILEGEGEAGIADEIRAMPVDDWGLATLAHGFTCQIVEEF